jgi:hypothetical protein
MEMQIRRPAAPDYQVNPAILAAREQQGGLTDLEVAQKVVFSNEWFVFLDADPFLATGRLTAAGRKLLPVIRQDYGDELPAGMVDWVRLYQCAHNRALNQFQSWPEVSPQTCPRADNWSWGGRA